jgi:hypothetical protein
MTKCRSIARKADKFERVAQKLRVESTRLQ